MAFDQDLALRVRRLLGEAQGFSERKMFGGICFILNGRMSAGVLGEDLIVRVPPDEYEKAMRAPGARPMDFNRPAHAWLSTGGATRIQDRNRHVGVVGPQRCRGSGGRDSPFKEAPREPGQDTGPQPGRSKRPVREARPLTRTATASCSRHAP
jgi:hypothetical protein